MNTIDIDVGGTFTDLVLNFDGKSIYAKTPSTPYDLSECFINVLHQGAKSLNLSLQELLSKVQTVRYSTTIAMNRLIERKGIALGLIATEGHEDAIFIGKGAQWVDGKRPAERKNLAIQKKPEPLIPREMVVGIKERIDSFGNVIRPLDEDDVRSKVYHLIDKGVRGFVVSLLWSPVNPVHEKRIKEIIREEYKPYYLGYLPIVLASDVLGRLGEYQRTMTAILDAYLQRAMQIELSAMWDRIREYGYRGPFIMVHNSGGMAGIFKTDAIRTYNAGPVSGLMGAYFIALALGYRNVIAADMGGTSFDIGVIVEHSVRSYQFQPIIDQWMVGVTMLETLSIGAGGGSIAWVNEVAGRTEVGPQSTGSYPGPACYNLGGTEATVTDADVVLGYINPDYYYGGKMKLSKELALNAIKNKIADPLGLDVVEAAHLIRKIVDGNMAAAMRKEIQLRGYDPKEFALFVLGGGGPTHVEGYTQDISAVIMFPFSPVFCAAGSSMMDITYIYELSHRFMFMEPATKKLTEDYDQFNGIVQMLMEKAKSEIEAEGLPVAKIVFNLELDMLYGGQVQRKRSLSPKLFIKNEDDAKAVYQAFEQEFSETFTPIVVYPEGGVYIDTYILKATIPTVRPALAKYKLGTEDPGKAIKGKRNVFWEDGGFVETSIFDYSLLVPGNVAKGPAVIEAEYTTIVVPPHLQYRVDEYNFGRLEKK